MSKYKHKFKVGDKLEIVSNKFSSHMYDDGDIVDVMRVFMSKGFGFYDTCNKATGDCWTVDERDVKLNSKNKTKTKEMSTFKNEVLKAATKLLKANNTVTTLEIKTELRTSVITSGLYSTQKMVSDAMAELTNEGKFTYDDSNGTYRVYSRAGQALAVTSPHTNDVKVRPVGTTSRITRRKALELISNNKGHFFTVEFVKQEDNTLRTMNCQYLSGQDLDPLGVVKVKEAAKLKAYNKAVKEGKTPKKDYIRSFNVNTLKSLTMGGNIYKARNS